MKLLKTILIGGVVFFGGRYLLSLNRASKKAVVQVGGRVHKVTFAGIVVVINYNIKNPTNASMEMAVPLIKLSHNGKLLASSSMELVEIPEDAQSANGRIMIKPNEETGNIATSILLPYLSLIGLGASLIASLKDRLNASSDEKKIKFEIETNSTIYTKVGRYPYEDKQIINV